MQYLLYIEIFTKPAQHEEKIKLGETLYLEHCLKTKFETIQDMSFA